jgi:tRNA-splicing ligase RtcB
MGNDFGCLKEIAPGFFEIPKEGHMRVPGLVVASKKLLTEAHLHRALDQVKNVAHLPGIVGYSVAMPDIHWGYGFPIGGVAAMDLDEGVVSPGGVGYDINCGVRLAIYDEPLHRLTPFVKENLLKTIYSLVPSGLHQENAALKSLTQKDYQHIAEKGIAWSLDRGYALKDDVSRMESCGFLPGGSLDFISEIARQRGARQLGTIGSGNHFIEMGSVNKIFCAKTAHSWKIPLGATYILIHSGSRGFGHQVCQDFISKLSKNALTATLPDRQLACALIKSSEGQGYLGAMATAANYAFNNRQLILYHVRKAFKTCLNVPPEKIRLVYDVCHNIAKTEVHLVDGKEKKLLVHRKGATRAFGPHHPELPYDFQITGQPVMVPGDMERASYILQGLGHLLTFASACHGAGRHLSRTECLARFKGSDLIEQMQKKNITVMAKSLRTVAEEMPEAYKDVDEVVAAVQNAQLANIVAKLKPELVIKG